MQRSSFHLFILILIILCAGIGVVIQFITFVPAIVSTGQTTGEAIVRVCSYFTIISNTMIIVTTTTVLLFPNNEWGQRWEKTGTISALTVYIIVVGLVYNLVLRAINHVEGLGRVGDELVHSAVPVLYIIYWMFFAVKGRVGWKDAYRWMVFPFLYLAYTFTHGLVSDWYPYPFMDANKIGYAGFWLNCFFLLLLFVTLNLAVISADKLLAKQKKKLLMLPKNLYVIR